MRKGKVFLLAVCAGVMISVGGTIYLSVENKVIGSLLFTVGLYAIVLNGLFLYTGKVGYFPVQQDKKSYLLILLLTWLGNLCGTMAGAWALRLTRIRNIQEAAKEMCSTKMSDQPASILVLAFFCGLLMFIAVDGYKEKGNPLILFVCVSVFILCCFEHCIANMFYITLGGMWSVKAVGYLLIMTAGNSLGGMLIPAVKSMKSE